MFFARLLFVSQLQIKPHVDLEWKIMQTPIQTAENFATRLAREVLWLSHDLLDISAAVPIPKRQFDISRINKLNVESANFSL